MSKPSLSLHQSRLNVSLIKTRCRASRRGEVFSPVGVRLPNPYENVHLCLEFAIYQTHVRLKLFFKPFSQKPSSIYKT